METVLNKLQEGVKYPRFERDATRIINDLVSHITQERGIYSSSIEPNPNEHKIWFNTSTNILMIYNNGSWRDFDRNNSGKTKIISNPTKEEISNDSVRYTINDNAFYIITDAYKQNIEISNIDDYDFWLYIETMPYTITFYGTVITNLNDIYTKYGNWDYFTVLAHKIGNVVEFTVIISDISYRQKYFTKRDKAYLVLVKNDETLVNIVKIAHTQSDSNLKFIDFGYSITTSPNYPYDYSIVIQKANVQLLYPPYHFPLDFIRAFPKAQQGVAKSYMPKCLVINNLGNDEYNNPFSINNNDIEYIIGKDYLSSEINPDRLYPIIPDTLVLNADVKFMDNFAESAFIRFPIRGNNTKKSLIIKKTSVFAGINCDENIPLDDRTMYFKNLIIEDFGVLSTDMLAYNDDFGAFGANNVYLMGGEPTHIIDNIYEGRILVNNALIYGSNFNNKSFIFDCTSKIKYIVIACKLNENHFTTIGALDNNDIIFTLKENIDILKKFGIKPINGFVPITVNTVKDNDGFIVSESYNLTDYNINDFTRFEVPLVSY